MTYIDRRLTGAKLKAQTESGRARAYPETRAEWLALYQRRHEAYVGDPYSVSEMKELHLFRALDEDGEVMAETRRLTRDVQYVVDTHVDALIAGGLTLSRGPNGQAKDLKDAQAVWDRSGLGEHLERYLRNGATLGDMHFEAVRTDKGSKVVSYDPQHVELTYDAETGTQLERAVITIPYFEPRTVGKGGEPGPEQEILRQYIRVLTPGHIQVFRDGEPSPSESGPTNIPACTLVHVPYIPYRIPEYGMSAAHQLDDCLTLIDSFLTQIHAIGTRHGNPLLQSAGGKVGASSAIGRLGRIVNGPKDWSMSFVEPTFSGLATLLQAVQTHRETLRETMPEFLFTESGANASGSALNFRATQFVQKLRKIRRRIYHGLVRCLAIAVALERGSSEVKHRSIEIDAGDILPANVNALLEQLRLTKEIHPLRPEDIIAHYQRVGILPADIDAAEYAASVEPPPADAPSLEEDEEEE